MRHAAGQEQAPDHRESRSLSVANQRRLRETRSHGGGTAESEKPDRSLNLWGGGSIMQALSSIVMDASSSGQTESTHATRYVLDANLFDL